MSDAPAIWIDGREAATLPLPDRGLEFGDGLFETVLVVAGRIPLKNFHFSRLQSGLATLQFPSLCDRVEQHLEVALAALTTKLNYALRITVTRGSGPRGYAPPTAPQARVVISATQVTGDPLTMPAPASLGVSRIRWGTQPALAGMKHLNRLEQVMAAQERQAAGWDEALMLDQAGAPVSVTAGNLFMVSGETLVTAALEDCGIAGTRRQFFIERGAPDLGLQVRVATLSLDELLAADEVFYCNALVGLRPVGELAGKRWSSQPVCSRLFQYYAQELDV